MTSVGILPEYDPGYFQDLAHIERGMRAELTEKYKLRAVIVKLNFPTMKMSSYYL